MYEHKKIEKKWQRIWEKEKPWKASGLSEKKKYYSLVEFPYPSGDGLHVGHVRSYTALDALSRKRRMEGYNVLYPMGWDAFGLPTEQYAIKTGVSPQEVTKKNIKIFKRQLKSLGFSFDWDKEINTTDPNYYKWTQWIFLQLFKHGLAYKDTSYIHWCPSCRIGLANEEVISGKCERCGSEVEKKIKKQWMLKITAYADKLLEGLNKVDYLEEIKTQQRNWIGRSEGRELEFSIYPKKRLSRRHVADVPPHNDEGVIKVFTTRPDTIDGVTYLVLAPENPLIAELPIKNEKEVEKYIKKATNKSDLERQENKVKTGVELKGMVAVNPYNNKKIPIWISDYVLMGYGTGAIMAVPQHDERDREFAEKYKLPIIDCPLVVKRKWPGKKRINYKLRDWVFSRQRYWGEPIPIIICDKCGYVPVPEKDLPVKLPRVEKYQPVSDGRSPLASSEKWLKVKCPICSGSARRETDVMPNWAGSSWYYLAYCIKKDNDYPLATRHSPLPYWLPVDWYNGGMEHTTLHLLYSRFWNQFLYDIGVSPVSEPYQKRTAHGMVLGDNGEKMSKSKGNVVNPDDLVEKFGADALRLYEMFIAPFRDTAPWNPQGIVGTQRFLNKINDLAQKTNSNSKNSNKELERLLHQTIKKVSEDIEEMKFNTAVSALMVLVNKMEEASIKSTIPDSYFLILLKLLFPFAPHIAQELYSTAVAEEIASSFLRNAPRNDDANSVIASSAKQSSSVIASSAKQSRLDFQSWPKWDKKLIIEETFDLIVQINGRVKATVIARKGITKKEAGKTAIQLPAIKKCLKNKITSKVIFVSDRLINFVIE